MSIGKKFTIDEIRLNVERYNYKLISDTYINANTPMQLCCDKGHTFNMTWASFQQGRRCHVCKGGVKLSFEEVEKIINSNGCILLSTSYKNSSTKLKIECKCHNIFHKTFNEFNSQNQKQCRECGIKKRADKKRLSFEDVKSYINNEGYELLQDYYIDSKVKLKLKCTVGHTYEAKFNSFKSGKRCPICANNKQLTQLEIEEIIISKGFVLLTKEYSNIKETLIIQCDKGHVFESSFTKFQHRGFTCTTCGIDGRSGKNHYCWKGGIKPIYNYLRSKLYEWKKESFNYYKGQCVITEQVTDVEIHHLYGFDMIFQELFEITNLEIKSVIGEYSDNELKLLEDVCNLLHRKYPLGVCLIKEFHDEFHKIYGYGKNTPEQFYEFYRMKTGKEYKQEQTDNTII